jgi:hypothetical protein
VRASVRDTTVPRFNPPAGNRPGQSDSENGIWPGQSDGRTDRQIFYGRTGPDRRPLYNFDQRSLVSLSVSGQSVCDGGYQGWYLCGSQTGFEKKPNIHLELSGLSDWRAGQGQGSSYRQGRAGRQGQGQGRPGKKTWEILGYGFQDMVFRTWDLNFGAWEILGYGFQDLRSQLWGLDFHTRGFQDRNLKTFRTWFPGCGISILGPGFHTGGFTVAFGHGHPLVLDKLIELSVKSCPVGPELHPSFDAPSPPLLAVVHKVMTFY